MIHRGRVAADDHRWDGPGDERGLVPEPGSSWIAITVAPGGGLNTQICVDLTAPGCGG